MTPDSKQPQIFLAHASEDKDRVRDLYFKLRSTGFRPWLDAEDLIPGQNWRTEIPKAIQASQIFIACLSDRSVQKKGYVQKEFRLALDVYAERPQGSIYIIPVKFDECEVPDIEAPNLGVRLQDIHWLELWQEDGFERLARAIQYALGTGPDEQSDSEKDSEVRAGPFAILLSGGKYRRSFQVGLDKVHSLDVSNDDWGKNHTLIKWDGKKMVEELGTGHFKFVASDGNRNVAVAVRVDWHWWTHHLQNIKVEVDGRVLHNEGGD